MLRRVRLFVAMVDVLAVAGALLLYALQPNIDAASAQATICLVALSLAMHAMPYQRPTRGSSGSIAFVPILASLVLSPSWLSVVAVAACMAAIELWAGRAPIKIAFNIGQHSLCAALAALVFRFAGGTALLVNQDFQILPIVLAGATFMLANSLAVSTVVGLSESKSILQVWRANSASGVVYDLLALPVVYAFARVYIEWGVTGTLLLAVPLLGMRQLYKTNWLLEKTNRELLELMVAAIEARDPYTSGHSRRVARYAGLVARAMGLGGKELERVSVAALLHDVGKIHEVFAPILQKPGRLTSEEQAVMETHPAKSVELIRNVSHLQDILPAVLHHHENWDGTGYPHGLAGELIPLGARIIRFADTIDAMTSDRPYRAALTKAEVRAELVRCRGSQFDPAICDALLSSVYFDRLFDSTGVVTPLASAIISRKKRLQSA